MRSHYTRPMWEDQRLCWESLRPHLPEARPGADLFGPRWFPPPLVDPVWWGRDGMQVLASVDEAADGSRWVHASYSREDRIPDHADTLAVRRLIFQPDAVVVAVFPPEAEYVNDHARCLHLWSRLGFGRLVPDLRSYDVLTGRVGI